MALFKFMTAEPFRVRSLERDRKTDTARLAKLRSLLDEFNAGIIQEYEGLRARHERVEARAAFSLQSLENDPSDKSMSTAVDDLAATMIRYAARLKALDEQIGFVTELCEHVDRFPLESEALEDRSPLAGEASPVKPRS